MSSRVFGITTPDGLDLINTGVGGVQRPRDLIEADFAFDIAVRAPVLQTHRRPSRKALQAFAAASRRRSRTKPAGAFAARPVSGAMDHHNAVFVQQAPADRVRRFRPARAHRPWRRSRLRARAALSSELSTTSRRAAILPLHLRNAILRTRERDRRRILHERRRAAARLRQHHEHALDQGRRSRAITHAPAGHGIRFRKAVDVQIAVAQARHRRQRRDMLVLVVSDGFVDFIADQRTCRAVRRSPRSASSSAAVNTVPTGFQGVFRISAFTPDVQARFQRLPEAERTARFRAAPAPDGALRPPAEWAIDRRRKSDRAAGPHRLRSAERSAPHRCRRWLRRSPESRSRGRSCRPIIPLQFQRDGLAKILLAAVIGIAGAAVVQRARAGLHDVRRRGKIGLAAHQRDEVPALRLQLPDFGKNGVDGGGLKCCDTIHESRM